MVIKNWEPFVSLPELAIPVTFSIQKLLTVTSSQRTQQPSLSVLQLEILVGELLPVYGLATSTYKHNISITPHTATFRVS